MKILTVKQATDITEHAVKQFADYLRHGAIQTIVLGISGGRDSAIMAALSLRTIEQGKIDGFKCNYIFDFIGVESDHSDLLKARELAKTLNFKLGEYDYSNWYQMSPIREEKHLTLPKIRVARGNLKCRIRMLHLYDRAQLYQGIVLDTDDLSEYLMGFWTKHGDVGDVKVIQFLTKDEVGDLGEYLGVCRSILDSAPGDGLGVTATNKATDQLRMSYLKIDYVMSRLIQNLFDYNGELSQLQDKKYLDLMALIAAEIDEPLDNIVHVAGQSLKTSFKRKYGDDVAILLPNRSLIGLPELGTDEFNSVYLKAIKL